MTVKILKVTEAKSFQIDYNGRSFWLRQGQLQEDLQAIIAIAEQTGRNEIRAGLSKLLKEETR